MSDYRCLHFIDPLFNKASQLRTNSYFTMMAYLGQNLTRMTLGQLCSALWDFRSRPVVKQPGIEPGSVVTPLALRCSALDRCATREPPRVVFTNVSQKNALKIQGALLDSQQTTFTHLFFFYCSFYNAGVSNSFN